MDHLEKIKNNLTHSVPDPEIELKTPEELVDDWLKSAEGDVERPLTTCMPSIDKTLRNKLRGTVGAYIGKGGSKKSLLALQGCRHNVLTYQNNCTGIYSNMEMGVFQFMSRLMNMSFQVDGSWGSSEHYDYEFTNAFKSKNNERIEQIRKELKTKFRDLYGNNLYVNSRGSMSIDDYYKLVRKSKSINGRVDQLAIDGLSMMANVGNETESYTTHSKELKDLAKQENIYIILICHVTKGCDKHTRDLQPFIRGSEKILDNVDFVVMMSQIIDQFLSSDDNIKYMKNKGWIQMYDKRGTGDIIDLVYNFDSKSLLLTESEEDPKLYEVEKKKQSKSFFT
jgi:replicative DNA helicase